MDTLSNDVLVVDPVIDLDAPEVDDMRFVVTLVPHAELYTRPIALRFAAIDFDEQAAEELLASLN